MDSGPNTVTIEVAYEDALRLWVFVNVPVEAAKFDHRADGRIRKLVNDAITRTENDYSEAQDG